VITSEVTIDPAGAGLLEVAFQDRVRLVEQAPGFQRIEVWRDAARPGVFQMVSWWDSDEQFRTYMRSQDHRASHARIPAAPHKPRGTGVRRYSVVPDEQPRG
jgi:heme-degrading monooxygenase HmoA